MNRPEWDRPSTTGRNRETTHVPWGSYENVVQAKTCDCRVSKYTKLLNGSWKFRLFQSPVAAPKFFSPDFDSQGWMEIPVPASWASYAEITAPAEQTSADKKVPAVPLASGLNPTGCYLTKFTVPEEWRGRLFFLSFDSVQSAFHLWINGVEVGFSTDSRLPAEFDITPYAHVGENTLAVRVVQNAAGSCLENREHKRYGGIRGDVVIYAKPRTHIRDFTVNTRLARGSDNATLDIQVFASPFGAGDNWSITAELFAPDGTPVFNTPLCKQLVASEVLPTGEKEPAFSTHLTASVMAPRLWSAETPELYTLVLTLCAPDFQPVDYESCRVGFRQVEFEGGELFLNGKRLRLQGLDLRETATDNRQVSTREQIRAQIVLLKQRNYNAVRLYQNASEEHWHTLGNELGLYIIAAANIRPDDPWQALAKDPAWAGTFLKRATRMVLRNRNYPCIVAWSLSHGLNSDSPHIAGMAAWVRAFDRGRPTDVDCNVPGGAGNSLLLPKDWSTPAKPPITIEALDTKSTLAGSFHVENLYFSMDLSHLELEWFLQANGKDLQTGIMNMPALLPFQPPAKLKIPFLPVEAQANTEYFLNFRCVLNRDLPWAPKGHIVAQYQFKLPLPVKHDGRAGQPMVRTPVKSACDHMRIIVNPVEGSLDALRVDDFDLLANRARPSFALIAPLESASAKSGKTNLTTILKSSHILHLQQQLNQSENAEIGLRLIFNEVYVTTGGELVAESKTHYEFVDGLLSLHVDIAVAEAFPPMSYASIELPLNHKVNDIEWFGCGARGAHVRNSNSQSAIVGLRRMTIAELCEILQMRNERSSTFGNVRWVAVTNKDGVGLRLKAVRPLFEFSIRKDRIVSVNEMTNDSNSWQWLLNLKFRPDVPRQETRRICFDLHFEAGVPETIKTEAAPEKTQA